jgi:hypothetical protein
MVEKSTYRNQMYHNYLLNIILRIYYLCQALVAHACNPSYSGGRDQEGFVVQSQLRQTVCETLFRKNPSQERAGEVARV